MITPQFQAKFNTWLNKSLCQPIPSSIIAFNFNLAEPWCIELIGAETYNEQNEDWACNESFRSKGRAFSLPKSEVGSDWKTVLTSSENLIEAYLENPSPGANILKAATAVTVGFVDGNLTRIWPR